MRIDLHRFAASFLPDSPADRAVLLTGPAPQPGSATSEPERSVDHGFADALQWLRAHHLVPALDDGVIDPAREAQRALRFERAAGHRYY